MTTTFIFHTDPGHGWLEVSWRDLKAVALNPSDFSRYSYRRGNVFYLEEDCDAPKFVERWKAIKVEIDFDESYSERTFIRSLPPIHA